jgi:hypothetical protein
LILFGHLCEHFGYMCHPNRGWSVYLQLARSATLASPMQLFPCKGIFEVDFSFSAELGF